MTDTNPIIANWDGPHGLPRYDLIDDAKFEPALDAALADARANIAAIAENPDEPTLENTIHALELGEALLDRAGAIIFNMLGTDATPERQALQTKYAPLFSAYSSEVTANKALFARSEALHARTDEFEGEDRRAID